MHRLKLPNSDRLYGIVWIICNGERFFIMHLSLQSAVSQILVSQHPPRMEESFASLSRQKDCSIILQKGSMCIMRKNLHSASHRSIDIVFGIVPIVRE